MRKTLIVVDMQNDFIDGALGTKEAQSIVSNVAKKIKEYKENGCDVIFTRDTHPTNYLETYEGKHLPVVHCVKNTVGWQISDKLDFDIENNEIGKNFYNKKNYHARMETMIKKL